MMFRSSTLALRLVAAASHSLDAFTITLRNSRRRCNFSSAWHAINNPRLSAEAEDDDGKDEEATPKTSTYNEEESEAEENIKGKGGIVIKVEALQTGN
jgi:hypothetical protein